VCIAFQHAQKRNKRPHGFTILHRHNTRDLVQMREVVRCPGGEKFGKLYWAERRVFGALPEISRLEIHRAEFVEILRAERIEFVEQIGDGLALYFCLVSLAIETLERFRFAELPDARHPIRFFAIHEMTDDVQNGPRLFALVAERPLFGKIAQERVESHRRAREKCDGLIEIVFHGVPRFGGTGF
jgi:hypothetical protein